MNESTTAIESARPPWANRMAAATGAIAYSLFYVKQGYEAPWPAPGAPSLQLVEGLLHLLLLPAVVLLMQAALAHHLPRFVPAATRGAFLRAERWTHLVWLAGIVFGVSARMSPALTFAMLAALAVLQAGLIERHAGARSTERAHYRVAVLFACSGFAALVYQVCWQRALFTEFGVNCESVTVIVSVFMFGLGLGALAGGWLQRRFPGRLLLMFVVAEVGIGLFGLGSLHFIRAMAPVAGSSLAEMTLRVYALLGVPTLLMGATLPVLVAHLQRRVRDIGRTVGLLYALNTLGSAVAAFATVHVLFVLAGLQASVLVAACANFVTAALALWTARQLPALPAGRDADDRASVASSGGLSGAAAFTALAGIGFLSLSLEILWYRLAGFLTASRPDVFGMLLAAYLTGIAFGALRAPGGMDGAAARRHVARWLAFAAAATYLALPAVSWTAAVAGREAAVLAAYAMAGFVAYCCGAAFPLLIALATPRAGNASGTRVAWLYFGNIVGSALGPLVTGFYLLDRFDLATNMMLGAGLAILIAASLQPAAERRALLLRPAALGLAALAAVLYRPLHDGHLERMLHADWGHPPFKWVLEDRTAILAVEAAPQDIMYGHGIYDGRYNIDPVINSNLVDRAFMVGALHRHPERVLEIGLSTGSWTHVLSTYGPLRELVVVEIGAGYRTLMQRYPDVAGVLNDPRVKINVDDGRRWLRNRPAEKFDVIVMNNSFPWRSNSTHLLSREFLELAKAHLNPGGVIYYNALGWDDIPYTAAHVFKHVVAFSTFVAASDAPFDMSTEERRANLLRFKSAGAPTFEQDEAHRRKLGQLLDAPLPDLSVGLLAREDLLLITDDNMAMEYKAAR